MKHCEIFFLSISVSVKAELGVMWVSDLGVCALLKTAAPCLGCDLCRLVADRRSRPAGEETGHAVGFTAINQSSLAWPSLPYSTLTLTLLQ